MRYATIIEKSANNYSAYVPDLPGCIATGSTLDEVFCQLQAAISFHLEGLQLQGLTIPEPTTFGEDIEG
jgi:predicted RNase H-like HicB family nuclease